MAITPLAKVYWCRWPPIAVVYKCEGSSTGREEFQPNQLRIERARVGGRREQGGIPSTAATPLPRRTTPFPCASLARTEALDVNLLAFVEGPLGDYINRGLASLQSAVSKLVDFEPLPVSFLAFCGGGVRYGVAGFGPLFGAGQAAEIDSKGA
jgi:hypothetical protein